MAPATIATPVDSKADFTIQCVYAHRPGSAGDCGAGSASLPALAPTRVPTALAWSATRTRRSPRPTRPARKSPCSWTRPGSRPASTRPTPALDCHADITAKHPDDNVPAQPPSCAKCHEEEAQGLRHQHSWREPQLGASGAASCWDCHGTHDMLSAKNPDSPVFKLNLPRDLRQVPQQRRA